MIENGRVEKLIKAQGVTTLSSIWQDLKERD